MSLEGACQPQCFWLSPLNKQTPLSSKPSTKRPVYARTNLQKIQVNAINPFPISLIYNAASLGIDCCLQSASFVFRRVMDVIWAIFIIPGLIFRLFWSLLLWSISFILWVPLVFAFFLNKIVIFLKPRHMSNHNWIKSEMWQNPPKGGTFLYHF